MSVTPQFSFDSAGTDITYTDPKNKSKQLHFHIPSQLKENAERRALLDRLATEIFTQLASVPFCSNVLDIQLDLTSIQIETFDKENDSKQAAENNYQKLLQGILKQANDALNTHTPTPQVVPKRTLGSLFSLAYWHPKAPQPTIQPYVSPPPVGLSNYYKSMAANINGDLFIGATGLEGASIGTVAYYFYQFLTNEAANSAVKPHLHLLLDRLGKGLKLYNTLDQTISYEARENTHA